MYAAVKGLAPKTQAIQHVANGLTCCTKATAMSVPSDDLSGRLYLLGTLKGFCQKGRIINNVECGNAAR